MSPALNRGTVKNTTQASVIDMHQTVCLARILESQTQIGIPITANKK